MKKKILAYGLFVFLLIITIGSFGFISVWAQDYEYDSEEDVLYLNLIHGVISKDMVISEENVVIAEDLYIPQGYTVTVTGSITVMGDIYVFGTLNNQGTINGSTIYALHYNSMMSAGKYDYGYFKNTGKVDVDELNITDQYLDIKIPPTKHIWDSGEITYEPLCEDVGEKVYKCTICEEEKIEDIPATGHKWALRYDSGNKYDLYCTECEEYSKYPACKNKDGYYYVFEKKVNGIFMHSVYDKNAKLIRKEKCTPFEWDEDVYGHSATCKCRVEVIFNQKHTLVSKINKSYAPDFGLITKRCKICKEIIFQRLIYPAKSVEMSKKAYVYNGKNHKPKITVKDSQGKKISPDNYTVIYSNNRNIGKATALIKFKGEKYGGKLKKTYIIKPQATKIYKSAITSNKMQLKWKKKKNIDGYEIQYALNKKFKKGSVKSIDKKAKISSVKIKNVKPNKKYYIRIRTYKKVNGKKYYSDWRNANC